MKKQVWSICFICLLSSLLLTACIDKYKDYYRLSGDDIYIENYAVKGVPGMQDRFYIIESDDDLALARNDYEHFDELPGINGILKEYPLDKYTCFIEMTCMGGEEEVTLKGILIDKETNRIYTDSEYKRKNSQHPIGAVTFWVSYAVIEKDKLQGFDLSEQKEEIYGR